MAFRSPFLDSTFNFNHSNSCRVSFFNTVNFLNPLSLQTQSQEGSKLLSSSPIPTIHGMMSMSPLTDLQIEENKYYTTGSYRKISIKIKII